MVAIRNSDAGRFLERPPAHIFLYLVFGADAGLVSERARALVAGAIADPKDPFQFVRMNGDDLAGDPHRLAEEAHTIPLFGGRRAIRVEATGKSLIAAVEPLLAVPPQDCTIVIEAGALKKDVALRKICEREKCAAAIECTPDSAADLGQLIKETVAASGLTISAEAQAMLEALLGEDRLMTRLELEKLVLYARDAGEIGPQHVEAIVSDAASRWVDQPVNAAFSGDFGALDSGMARVVGVGGDVNGLLGAALRHAVALHRARLSIEGRDAGPGEAPRMGQGFWRGPAFDGHLRAWTGERLLPAIAVLGEAIAAARREPKLAQAIAMRALWKVAQSARQGRAGRPAR